MFGLFQNKTRNNLNMIIALLSEDYPNIEKILDLDYDDTTEIRKYKETLRAIRGKN